MRERKSVKFRVDMYSDTKFKIIDMKPERDVIHYIWNRVVILAGKVNLDGDLYMSKNIPYTIETFAIEFNRSEKQVKLALDVFTELEMIEFDENKIYRVKNFAKHQNIKVKEKARDEDKTREIEYIEATQEEVLKDQVCDNNKEESDNKDDKSKLIDFENKDRIGVKIANSGISKDNNITNITEIDSTKESIPISIKTKKDKNVRKKKKNDAQLDITEEDVADAVGGWFTDDDLPINKDDRVVMSMTF